MSIAFTRRSLLALLASLGMTASTMAHGGGHGGGFHGGGFHGGGFYHHGYGYGGFYPGFGFGGFYPGWGLGGFGYGGYGYPGYYGGLGYGGLGYGGMGYGGLGYGQGAPPIVVTPPPVIVTPPPPPPPAGPPLPPPKAGVPGILPTLNGSVPVPVPANKCRVIVHLPADAALWFDGELTTQTGAEREFMTPELPTDRTYFYDLRARWMQNGQELERTIAIKVRRNTTQEADFNSLPAPRE